MSSLLLPFDSTQDLNMSLLSDVYSTPGVTAKMATPTKVDSELSDVHLELLERREGEEGMPLRPEV